MSAQSTVNGIKVSLSKLLPADSMTPEAVEQCKDMLGQLERVSVSLDILTETLIGTVVSKFKGNAEVAPIAKALVKKWKKVAKGGGGSASSEGAASKPPPKVKVERRDSTNSATAAIEEEWSMLQPHRQTSVKKLHSFLLGHKRQLVKDEVMHASAVEHLSVERATEIETVIQEMLGRDKQDYLGKARSLCFNLKKNAPLAIQILLGHITPKDLVSMTPEQLASDDKRKEMEDRARKILDTNRLDWDRANEDKINEMCGISGDLLKASLFTCGRCKSTKTTSTQKQTRSADEPMTVFVLCLNCGKRWKC